MLKLKVPDMACSACADTITKAVRQLDDSAKVEADLDQKTVAIETQQSEDAVKAAITEAGYSIA
ncbi:hypothetical protein CKA32_003173 [Geitlerinema sp. FC II]|uniref:heavy-metal-associated domain-containing protein n=1 Tax=Baaleninema simplex TaxID=2862350 RepID=UPI00035D312B|nr:heavy-metal-associated domain-containing protein [Baaleninema simplex]MDC0831928.1 heavy-metal-associated domain-containing protein [Geitlerinema sp. CS-897]PPT05775.1 hypothetical protein CKA32_003173 [Geitlerinema sp. FC II]